MMDKHNYRVFSDALPGVTRDGACEGPLKRDVRESDFI